MIKPVEALLPWEMGLPQQALAPCDLAVVVLLLAEGIEELAGASALGLSLLHERRQWLPNRASLSCLSSSGRAASTACERGTGEEVVIGGQLVLGNHGIRQGAPARRHPEALLQEREREGLALLGLL